ncbi:MAG: substrate-binding domain-containing protein [Spirochaetaceae bacterium]|nr:substrate-binding domain-containing protein [Spirochaetaceae bacterium]MDT8298901.1 substrate-binding domain-containing protein [Spirochaetaceae bacterium]
MRSLPMIYLLAAAALMLSACGGSDFDNRIIASGSSTVAPLMEVLLEDYVQAGFDGTISLDSIGTRAGFSRFIQGSSNLVTASRPITEEEVRLAEAAGLSPKGFLIAKDAVSVCTGGGVTGEVTLNELAELLTADLWSDVRIEWPDEPVHKYYPGLDSGTFAFITQILYGGDSTQILSSEYLQMSEDDNVLVQGILKDPWSLGFFGYSYAVERDFPLDVLAVNGLKPVDGAEYSLTRPLFLYIDANRSNEYPAPAEFVAYVLDRAAGGTLPEGFLPAGGDSIADGVKELDILRREADL